MAVKKSAAEKEVKETKTAKAPKAAKTAKAPAAQPTVAKSALKPAKPSASGSAVLEQMRRAKAAEAEGKAELVADCLDLCYVEDLRYY